MRKYWKIVVIVLLVTCVCVIIFQRQFLINIFSSIIRSFLNFSEGNRVIIIAAIVTGILAIIAAVITGIPAIIAPVIVRKLDLLKEQKDKQEQKENKEFEDWKREYKQTLLSKLRNKDSAQSGSAAHLLFSEAVKSATLPVQLENRSKNSEHPDLHYDPVQHILELERDAKGQKLQEFLEDPKYGSHYTLYGGSGSGKTLYLKIMALKAAKESIKVAGMEVKIEYPIYIDLKDFVKQPLVDSNNSLLNFIIKSLQQEYGFPKNQTDSHIEELLKGGKVLLLLDSSGDMFNDEPNSYNEVIVKIYNQLSAIKSKYNNFPTVVATRKLPTTSTPGARGACLIIEDITPETARFFIKNCSVPSFDTAKKSILEDELENFPRLRNFASTPLALSYAISMHLEISSERSLLSSRTKLYQGYINELLANRSRTALAGSFHQFRAYFPPDFRVLQPLAWFYHTKRCIDIGRSKLTNKQIQSLLACIAWKLHSQNRYNFTKEEIHKYIKEWLMENKLKENKQKEGEQKILEELVFKDGLLREHVKYKDVYEFSSLALQEYFAMLYVSEEQTQTSRLNTLYNYRNNLWWEEVIALFIQHNAPTMQETPPVISTTLSPIIQNPYHFVQTLAGLTTIPSDEKYYTNLLLAEKGLVNILPHYSHLQKLHREIHLRMYSLLVSPALVSSLPLFVQQQIVSAFLEEGIKNVQAHTLNPLIEPPIKDELETICDWLNKEGGEVPMLFLPLLVPLLKQDPDFLQRLMPKNATFIENLLRDFIAMDDSDLENNIVDDKIEIFIRKRFIYALCMRRRYSFSKHMYNIVKDGRGTLEIRECLASALGILSKSDEDITHLFELLENVAIPNSIRWHIITALGMLIDRGYVEVVTLLKEWYPKAKNEIGMQYKFFRLNIASLLFSKKSTGNEFFELSPDQFKDDTIAYNLAKILREVNNDNLIQDLFKKLLSNQGVALPEEEKIWICEILARVCKNKDDVELLHKKWNPPAGSLKEALDHLEWYAIRRQNSKPGNQQI